MRRQEKVERADRKRYDTKDLFKGSDVVGLSARVRGSVPVLSLKHIVPPLLFVGSKSQQYQHTKNMATHGTNDVYEVRPSSFTLHARATW